MAGNLPHNVTAIISLNVVPYMFSGFNVNMGAATNRVMKYDVMAKTWADALVPIQIDD